MSDVPPDSGAGLPAGQPWAFRTTHWSVVMQAGDSQSPESQQALEQLCRTYWYPLYSYVRRRGYDHLQAQDLTQGFFLQFLARDFLDVVDADRGRFRTFLLTALTRYLANMHHHAHRQRRGGGTTVVPLDDLAEQRYRVEPASDLPPERLFDRQWAHTVMKTALDRLATEMPVDRFAALKDFLLEGDGRVPYDEIALRLQLSVAAVTSAIHRMRSRFRSLVREHIAETILRPEEVDDEIRYLVSCLVDA